MKKGYTLAERIKAAFQLRRSKYAFTLAEVLITLGIIGIIAALTIPVLMAKFEKDKQVAALKKFYTTFANGINLAKAETGCNDLVCLGFEGSMSDAGWNDRMENLFRKYFKVLKVSRYGDDSIKSYDHTSLQGARTQEWNLKEGFAVETVDGMIFDIGTLVLAEGFPNARFVGVTIDINGPAKPNIVGRDIFSFALMEDGKFTAVRGMEYAQAAGKELWNAPGLCFYWRNTGGCEEHGCDKDTYGTGCTARIMEEGWQMNY